MKLFKNIVNTNKIVQNASIVKSNKLTYVVLLNYENIEDTHL